MSSGTLITLDTHCTTPVIAWAGIALGVTATPSNNPFDISSGLDNDVTSIIKGTNCKKQGGSAADITLHTFVNDLDGSGTYLANFTGGDGNYDVQIESVDEVGNTSLDSNLETVELDTTLPLVVVQSVATEGGVPGYGTAAGKVSQDTSFDIITFQFYWSEAPVQSDGYFVIHAKKTAFAVGDKPSFDNGTKYFSGGGGYALYDVVGGRTMWKTGSPPTPGTDMTTGRAAGAGAGKNGPISSSPDAGASNNQFVQIDSDDIVNIGVTDTQSNGAGMGTNFFIQVFVADNAGNVSNPS